MRRARRTSAVRDSPVGVLGSVADIHRSLRRRTASHRRRQTLRGGPPDQFALPRASTSEPELQCEKGLGESQVGTEKKAAS